MHFREPGVPRSGPWPGAAERRPTTRRPATAAAALGGSALLALGLLAGPGAAVASENESPSIAAAAPGSASVVLSNPPVYDGVVAAWPGDADKDPANAATEIDGIACWATSGDPYVRYLYVDVADDVIPDDAEKARVTVDYFDGGATGMDIHYDSQSSPWTGTPNLPLTGDGTWKSHEFALNNIRFENRSNGADFRLNIKANADVMPEICFSRIEVAFGDEPDPLAVTSPTLVFDEGSGAVEVSSTANEVDWTIGDANGVALTSGTAPISGGAGAVDVSGFGPGYYTVEVSADVNGETVTRRTSFGIVTPAPEGALDPDNYFAVALHYGWQKPEVEAALLDTIARIGWGNVRSDANWASIEREPGVYNFDTYAFDKGARPAAELGITSMPITGYRNPLYDDGKTASTPEGLDAFAAFNAATSMHYADITNDISVYNEYNSTGFNDGACGITAACYLDMLTRAYEAIHDANPDANVVAATSAGTQLAWHADFFDQGGLDHLDTFSVNFYGYQSGGPGTPPEETVMMTEFPELVDMVKQNQGDREIPIWITENGWPTHTAGSTETQQADYLIRAQVLAQSFGADKYFWYDAMDDGFDAGEREHRFGLLRRPYDHGCYPAWVCGPGDSDQSIMSIAPKPAAISNAVLIRQALGKELDDREDVGDDAVYSFPYVGPDDTTRVFWATEPRTVAVEASGPVELTDQFGQVSQLAPHRGTVTLDVDASPVFLTGDIDAIEVVNGSGFTLSAPDQSVTGATVPVTVTIDRSEQLIMPSRITVDVDGTTQTVTARPGRTTEVTLDLPATGLTGERDLTATITSDEHTVARLRATTTVVDPFTVSAQPAITGDGSDGYAYNLDIAVTNNHPTDDLDLTSLDWSLGSWAGTITNDLTVDAGGTGTFTTPITDAEPFTFYPYTVTATSPTFKAADTARLSFTPIEPADNTTLDPIDLQDLGRWISLRGGQHGGPDDLSGTIQFTYTDDALVLDAVINDDTHLGDRTDPATMWQIDSIQYSVYDTLPHVIDGTRTEVGAALLDAGPATYTWAPAPGNTPGPIPGADVDIIRDDEAGTTTYSLHVPWTALAYPDGPPGDIFGLSFLVNDADSPATSDARKGYYEWGSGVGAAPKNPAQFHTAQLVGSD
ncbi:hypothetical protein [Phytoactinopolyspora limicola]|uniref:hypothetical protein n=1 Tax=Phytoactinopolyspora limicola TaxID=2715536 RepID=UPI00140A1AE2|nr:hypothetical protein [Phytoactinopolyspora limicola]